MSGSLEMASRLFMGKLRNSRLERRREVQVLELEFPASDHQACASASLLCCF